MSHYMVRLLLADAILAGSMLAQTAGTGTLVGAVTDSTGAVVVGAKVSAVNAATAFVSRPPDIGV